MRRAGLRLLRWLGVLYIGYLAVTLLLLLPLLNVLAPKLVAEHLNRELRSELLLFNPFTLALEVRRASLHEGDGHRPLALKSLRIDLAINSIWEPGVVFDAFEIEELDLHVLRHADGRFHFDDLLATPAAGPAGDVEDNRELPALTLRRLTIDAHTLRYTDHTRRDSYSNALRDLLISTRNLTTVPERRGDGVLELYDPSGGVIRWSGDLDVAGGYSTGTLSVERIDLTHIWRYQAEALAFVAHGADFDATLNYTASWSGEPVLTLSDSQLRLHAVDISPGDTASLPDTGAGLDELAITGIALDTADRLLRADRLAVSGFMLSGYDDDRGVSPAAMFSSTAAADDPGAAAAPATPADDDEPAWQLQLQELTLDDSRIDWRTDYLSPEQLRVTPLRFSASDIHWPAERTAPFALALSLNDEMQLTVDGDMHLGTGVGAVRANLQRWQLEWLNPLLNRQARTDLRSGSLSAESSLELSDFSPARAHIDLRIVDLVSELHDTREQAFKLEQLAVTGADLDFGNSRITVQDVELQRPVGSLHIREDGTVNVNGVVREAPEAESEESSEERQERQESDGEAEQQSDAGDNGDSGATSADSEAWTVLIDRFALRNGQLDFADDSLPLPFKTVIDGIDAEVRDLDSSAEKPLSMQFTGSVDGYAPVIIEGRGRPLAEPRQGEMAFSFRGVDIATMSPYSGTYAGYRIDSGTLTLDLKYRIDGQSLAGDNRIVISQMQLGEPIESELAVDLPLKLGIALLTDTRGVIDLSVPITGNMNDPEFSIGGIVGKAIANVIAKAVTAPFRLLAGLVGSSDDLENIAFEAGTAKLQTEAQRGLSALAAALSERPQLRLRISGGYDPMEDGDAIRRRQLDEALLATGLSADSLARRDETWAAAVAALHAAQAPIVAGDGEEEPGAAELYSALAAQQSVPARKLEELATARAAAAKRELVTVGGVDAARISISTDAALASASAQMHLDS